METDTRHELSAQVADVVVERAGIDVPDFSTDLLEAGLIDSLALVTLIAALEETFAVQLPLDDFDVDRFRSVDTMAEFLASVGALPRS
jgi:D-alanine--poly(phosphoribitol) ligase subunit 2